MRESLRTAARKGVATAAALAALAASAACGPEKDTREVRQGTELFTSFSLDKACGLITKNGEAKVIRTAIVPGDLTLTAVQLDLESVAVSGDCGSTGWVPGPELGMQPQGSSAVGR